MHIFVLNFDFVSFLFIPVLKAIDEDSKEVPDLLTNYILKGRITVG